MYFNLLILKKCFSKTALSNLQQPIGGAATELFCELQSSDQCSSAN